MMRFYVCLTLACLLFLPVYVNAQNPFMSSGPVTSDSEAEPDNIASSKQSPERLRLMSLAPVRLLSERLAKTQSALRRDIEKLLNDPDDSALPVTILLLALFSFLYGMIHAAGPGHGKVFIGSYMLAGKPRFMDAFKAALAIVAAHTLSAGILIIAFMIYLGKVTLQNTAVAEGRLQLVSAALICLVGAYLFIRGIWGALKKNTDLSGAKEPGKPRGLFALAVSVGLIPCPGVLLVMLFAIHLGMIPAGIMAVLSMAMGMVVTITLIGWLFLAAGKSALRAGEVLGKRRMLISHGLTIVGALVIMGFGLLLFAGY
ncbi:MAG: hypothetical protein R6W75_12735 [Smithellaceae bacterium]